MIFNVLTLRQDIAMKKVMIFLSVIASLAGAAPSVQPERAWAISAGQTVVSMTMVDSQIVVVRSDGSVNLYTSGGALTESISFNLPLLAAPFFHDNAIIAVTKDGIAHAVVRRAGTVLWKTDLSADQASRPLLFEGSLWFGIGKGKDGLLVKVNRENGDLQVVAHFTSPVVTEPVLLNGNLVVSASNGTVKVIDVHTGLALFQDEVAGLYRGQKPLVMGDKLLLSPTGDYRKVEAVNAASLGKRAWSVSFERSWYGDAVELNTASVQPPLERKAALARALAPSLPVGLAKTLDPANEFVATGSVHTSSWVGLGKDAAITCEEMGAAGLSIAHILGVKVDSGTTIVDYQETVPSRRAVCPCRLIASRLCKHLALTHSPLAAPPATAPPPPPCTMTKLLPRDDLIPGRSSGHCELAGQWYSCGIARCSCIDNF